MKHFHLFYITFAIEIFLGISMLILLVLGKLLYEARQVQSRKVKKKLQEKIFLLMTRQKKLTDIDWGKEAIPRATLLNVLETYHANFHDDEWDKVETFLTEKYLLPWARLNVGRKRWIHRNHVARIFLLHTEKEDHKHISSLLKDKSFFIRMIAAEALGEIGLETTIEPLLLKMAQEPTSCRFIYRNVLLKMPFAHAAEILRVYKNAQEDAVRLCCLDILSYKYFGDVRNAIQHDLTSPNREIRLRVAKIMGNIASEAATTDLISLLEDEEPKVREAALFALGAILSEKSFEKIVPMIHDSIYEVRLQAARTLLAFKKRGRKVLEQQDWDIDPFAYEVARYVLTS